MQPGFPVASYSTTAAEVGEGNAETLRLRLEPQGLHVFTRTFDYACWARCAVHEHACSECTLNKASRKYTQAYKSNNKERRLPPP